VVLGILTAETDGTVCEQIMVVEPVCGTVVRNTGRNGLMAVRPEVTDTGISG